MDRTPPPESSIVRLSWQSPAVAEEDVASCSTGREVHGHNDGLHQLLRTSSGLAIISQRTYTIRCIRAHTIKMERKSYRRTRKLVRLTRSLSLTLGGQSLSKLSKAHDNMPCPRSMSVARFSSPSTRSRPRHRATKGLLPGQWARVGNDGAALVGEIDYFVGELYHAHRTLRLFYLRFQFLHLLKYVAKGLINLI